MDAIRALTEEIGPRLACSKEEGRASSWCAARLDELGYEVEVEAFPSRPHYQSWYAVYLGTSAAGAALLGIMPGATLILGLIGILLYARDAEGRPLIKPSKSSSQNVIARTPGVERPRMVVVAHVDSARSSLSFHPSTVANLRTSIVGLHLVLAAVPVLGAAGWVAEVGRGIPGFFWIPAVLLAGYLLFAMTLQLHAVTRMPVVAGANDNASGVEVLLRLAATHPPSTWFLVTGSEEAGMLGIQAYIEAHSEEIAEACHLNIDNVGAGTVIAAYEEGILRPHRADRALLAAAEEAGAEERSYVSLPTDATVLLARKYRAVSLLAVDDRGVLPNWHWPSDVAGNIEWETLDHATRIARSVVTSVVGADLR